MVVVVLSTKDLEQEKMMSTWMNPQAPDTVDCVAETAGSPELRLQVRGYEEPPESDPRSDALEGEAPQALDVISDHLFETLRGDNHLVFGGSRRTVSASSMMAIGGAVGCAAGSAARAARVRTRAAMVIDGAPFVHHPSSLRA